MRASVSDGVDTDPGPPSGTNATLYLDEQSVGSRAGRDG